MKGVNSFNHSKYPMDIKHCLKNNFTLDMSKIVLSYLRYETKHYSKKKQTKMLLLWNDFFKWLKKSCIVPERIFFIFAGSF